MAAATTTDEFLDLLKKSQLIDEERLEAVMRASGADLADKPKALAEKLVRQGLLTPFQAALILNGKWKGFQIAGGKYKLLQLLGIGGMGKVYLCEHIRMKRLVALKVLPLEQLQDKGSLERFNREAVAAAALNHPNIVKAYDLDQDGPLHFLVLEYVDGSSLQEIIKKHGPLDIARACHYVAQAALGLQHAHEAGWVHRDIKPGNLLLDRAGTVKILDMGLARFFEKSSGKGQLTEQLDSKPVLGTADYLAPEQAVNSSEVDIRADIYSLGATFYFLLTGRAPFEQGTITEKLLSHQMKEPASASSLRPEVPKPLEAILKKMMAKKPVHRYQSPAAIAEALQPWTTTAIEPPADEEMPRLCTALESLISNVPSGPMSSVNYPISNRFAGPRSAPISSSYLLRNGVSHLKWFGAPKSNKALVGGGMAAGLLVIGVFMLVSKFMGSEKKDVPAGPPVAAKLRPAPAAPPSQPAETISLVKAPAPTGRGISPVDAAKRVGERVTVEFEVHTTGATRDGTRVFLNSVDYREKGNFTIVLPMRKLESSLKAAGIADPKKHFEHKVVLVTGTVAIYNDAPQIEISELSQIEEVGK